MSFGGVWERNIHIVEQNFQLCHHGHIKQNLYKKVCYMNHTMLTHHARKMFLFSIMLSLKCNKLGKKKFHLHQSILNLFLVNKTSILHKGLSNHKGEIICISTPINTNTMWKRHVFFFHVCIRYTWLKSMINYY